MYPVFTKINKIGLNKTGFLALLLVLLLPACSNMPGANKPLSKQEQASKNRIQREFQQALILMQKNELPAAAEKFHDIIERYPQMAGAWANLGRIHIKSREWEKAREALQQAITLNPKQAPAYNYLGVVERNLGQFKASEYAYKQALENDPGYAIAWLNLGILYDIYMDKPALALPQYEQYQKLTKNTDKKVYKWIVELKRRIPKQSRLINIQGDRLNG
ncbi:hypothetical protein MNBD_GAMMA25-1221 [hydrothermal vent metagenome]|uniref:Uncharacterized protein n=1 Tax=hydrothermal vent metagenome TaxID=652676 RepID=A0A3B1AHQ7_9ZZZZ